MEILIRALAKSDNRKVFHCGNKELDHFFHRYAGQNQFRHHIGVTYVAIDSEENNILGYATVATGSIEAGELPSGQYPNNYQLPILRLGRLAVDKDEQGKGIAKKLLCYSLKLAINQKKTVGCVGVIVDAKPDTISFYEQYGFQKIEDIWEGQMKGYPEITPMFLSLKSIHS